jgi:trehalose 6-phosphate phosphatase
VVVPDTLRDTLERIRKGSGGAVALVSGRPIDDLDFIFQPLRLACVGGHGAEIRISPTGTALERRAPTLDRELRRRLSAIADDKPGVIVEDKGYSLALHYRLAMDKGLDVVDAVYKVCKEFPVDTLELLTGKAVIEIKSAGSNKGTAVQELMTHPPFQGRCPIFIGDDTTDEAAFAILPEFDGLGISVGRKVPGVAGRFQTPHDVRQWLERISRSELAEQS